MNFALLIAGLLLAGCGGDAFGVELDTAAAAPVATKIEAPAPDAIEPEVDATDRREEASVAPPEDSNTIESTPSCTQFPSNSRGQSPCLPCGGCGMQMVPQFYWAIVPNGCGGGDTPAACKDCREHYTCGCLRDAGEIAADAECELTDGGILTVWRGP